jgi:hypothetical protein
MEGLTLTPSITGIVKATRSKYELLHFGIVAQWQAFRSSVISYQIYLHRDTSLPKELVYAPQLIVVGSSPAWV